MRIGAVRGILVTPDGSTAAVRHTDLGSAPALPAVQLAMAAAERARNASRAPCPQNASRSSCEHWCRSVSAFDGPLLQARTSGRPCSDDSVFGRTCICSTDGSKDSASAMAECRSVCVAAAATPGGKGAAPDTHGSHDPAPKQSPAPLPKSTASDSSAAPKVQSKAGSSLPSAAAQPSGGGAGMSTQDMRFLLYDARFGVSFAAQWEILFTMAGVVAELNQRVGAACGASRSSQQCHRWMLVLPPWCAVLHWYSDATALPWRELFDTAGLGQEVPWIEYSDYHTAAGSVVDLAVLPVVAPSKGGSAKGFLGWVQDVRKCNGVGGQQLPQMSRRVNVISMTFSGFCDTDVSAAEFRCGQLRQASSAGIVEMVSSLASTDTRSVLLKHVDALKLHTPFGPLSRRMHPLLRPAPELVAVADRFIVGTLGERYPFLGVHLRQNEFLKEHPEASPGMEAAAARLNSLLAEHRLGQVFAVTDAPQDFRAALRRHVKAPLYFFAPDDGAHVPSHQGREAVMVLHILSQATRFIGTLGSAFSAAVRRERRVVGKSVSSTEVFCEWLTPRMADKQCVFPRGPG